MNENVLQILLRLFAIIAREDGATAAERDVVRAFLDSHLPSSEIQRYMERFEAYLAETEGQQVGGYCKSVAQELSRKHQLILLLHLLDLSHANGDVSPGELAHLQGVVEGFSIDTPIWEALRDYAWAAAPEDLVGADVLRIGPHAPAPDTGTRHLPLHMPGELAVLQVADGLLYLVKYFGDAHLQLNHAYLPPRENLVLRHGSVFNLPHGHTLYFSDIARAFLPLAESEQLSFACVDVGFRFPKGNTGLHPIQLQEQSGHLVAIMGASGSGKSTLLNVLNGNLRPSTGQVLINGNVLHDHLADMKGLIGYVPQDDLLIEDLSVYQNLYFNAKLCHKNLDHAALDALVMKVLLDLGLSETRDLRVGNPLEKTISGGQRKRLNIGLELLRAPAVIFFDEPTSGLSSRDSENIMDLLKELTFKGKLIFVVIHQPSSDIFKMFDSLLLLDTGGYPVYYGNPVEAVVYFRQVSAQAGQANAACDTCGNINPEQIFSIVEARVIDEFGNPTNQRRTAPERWHALYLQHRKAAAPPAAQSEVHSGLQTPGWFRQVEVFLRRDLLAKIGNRQYLAINLLQAPLLALILALLVRHSDSIPGIDGYLFGKNDNMPAFFFMSIVVALFVGMTMSAEEIFRDRKIRKRESFLSLSKGGYLLSKTSILFGFSALQMASFTLVSALLLDLPGLHLPYWLMLFSLGCFAVMLGLNISATFNSAVTIYILIPLLLIPQLILSGTVVRFDRLNPGFSAPGTVPIAADLMASRWAYEGLMVKFFKENAYQKGFYRESAKASEAVYYKDYWVPHMEAVLNACLRHQGAPHDSSAAHFADRKALLQAQLQAMQQRLPKLALPCADSLYAGQLSPTVGQCAASYLDAVQGQFVNQYTKAKAAIERHEQALIAQHGDGLAAFEYRHHNTAIDKLVRNTDSGTRLYEDGSTLVRTFEPVYQPPQSSHLLDYRSHFFAPEKHFLGFRLDTYAFNIGVIWLMTLLLFVTLYFELFRKAITWSVRK
jgi:ABC transport system ATP-binding/permease protein